MSTDELKLPLSMRICEVGQNRLEDGDDKLLLFFGEYDDEVVEKIVQIVNRHTSLVAENRELLNIIHLVGAQCGCGSTKNAIRLIINTVRKTEKIFNYKYDEPNLTGDEKKGEIK